MIRLVYVSTANFELGEADLKAILEVAESRNAAADITGLLVYNGRNFMQALEGDSASVLKLMGKISDDPRHSGVVVVVQDEIGERAFPDWSMRLTRASRAGALPQRLLQTNGVDASYVARLPREIARMFTSFNSLT